MGDVITRVRPSSTRGGNPVPVGEQRDTEHDQEAAAYRARRLESDEMAAVRQAAQWMIQRHKPYPALMIDRHWRLVGVQRSHPTERRAG